MLTNILQIVRFFCFPILGNASIGEEKKTEIVGNAVIQKNCVLVSRRFETSSLNQR